MWTAPTVGAASVTVGGVEVGVALAPVLLVLPVALAAVVYLAVRGEGDWDRRRRWIVAGTRLIVVACLVGAAAGPFTVTERTTAGDPTVQMLIDESDSMSVTDADADRLASAIEDQGVPVTRSVVGSDTVSRIGDAVAASARPNGSVLLVSDGQVTGGRSLIGAAEVAADAGATVHAVSLSAPTPERAVTLSGPAETSAGITNSFLVRVSGTSAVSEPTTVTVLADGTPIFTETVGETGRVEFTHTFDEVGTHQLVARIDGGDAIESNNQFRKTVRVVPKPPVLYVARGSYPFGELLDRLYDLDRRESIPDDLSPYRAVVLQDLPASAAGNVSALQRAVIDGTGLVVAGGRNAYDRGGYDNSSLGSMLPVAAGETTARTARISLLVDVSGSAQEGMETQKALALNVLNQLGDRNEVGIVGFNWRAYEVNRIVPLGENRESLRGKIRRLTSGGATDIGVGLRGAADQLGGSGTVILLSDGNTKPGARSVARRLARRGIQVVAVGVGRSVNEELLRDVARTTGGRYLRADETDRLRLLFGGGSRSFEGDKLTIVDRTQFITAGVETTASPGAVHDVGVKPGADFLVATGDGTPALAQWRYGLGRVVSITAYGSDGTLGGLLERPDSLLLSKSVNWAVGDPGPDRGVVSAPDTRVGESVTVRYAGSDRPAGPPAFRLVGPGTYEAELRPTEPGFRTVLNASLAVNYPREYTAFGQSEAVGRAVRATGGQVFEPGQAAAIAETVTRSFERTREVRQDWGWVLLAVGLLVFLGEVLARQLRLYGRPDGSGIGVAGDD
ncbi:MAG: VWA domain-containing protein [Salinirussus sp.]